MSDREHRRPERGYFHVRKDSIHSRSARDADPPFESFDVVLRGDYDALLAELEQAEGAATESEHRRARFMAELEQAERERDELRESELEWQRRGDRAIAAEANVAALVEALNELVEFTGRDWYHAPIGLKERIDTAIERAKTST